ncbi:sensor histidine kinase [Sphingomonas sp. NIC1]|uniref:HAMP domain-containing sensor histidine kinase n=1 Tax=Sphingomonas sp. NIC1 TaxID=1961362 RepID=UPI0007C0DF3E|nr:HAMP domain-containing sensor histidine kinase [Sphingomonas sp. NIC1]ANC87257.1 two-component sensor histidine kinase [Sphingomonas sp. NIC1]
MPRGRRLRAPRSLRALTWIFVAAMIAATLGTGVAIYTAQRRAIVQLVDQRIATAVDAIAHEGERPMPTPVLVERLRMLASDRDTGDIGAMLVDAQGRQIGGNIRLRQVPPRGFSSLHSDDGIKGLTAGRAYTGDVGDGRRLTMIAETEPFDDSGTARLRSYLAGFGSILLVVGLGLVMFSRLVERRIGAMRATAAAIVDGDMQRRVPTEGDGGAFDAQAHAFNAMLDRIAELMRGIAEVSSDIAHDLRSPLARLRGQLVQLERRAETPAMRDGLSAAIAQSDTILGMFAAILRIAEVEGGARRAGFARFDLGELVAEVGEMMAPVVEDDAHILVCDPVAALPVHADRQLLTQVLVNLIVNAVRHTPPGTRITLSAVAVRGQAIVRVADNGPGIAAADRATALRRFGRLDASRSTGGFGLGLPLAAAIARLHHGELSLEDAAPGLRVVLSVPLAA